MSQSQGTNQSQESLHSISSNPDWAVNGDGGITVGEDDDSPSPPLNQEALVQLQNVPVNGQPELGLKAGDCADLCRASDNSQSLLLIVSHGLTSLQGPSRCLGDLEVEPHKSCKPRTKIVCSNKDMATEVTRRATVMKIKEKGKPPKPKNWSSAKLVDWLSQHPRLDRDDIAFLRRQEFALFTALSAAAAEAAEEKANSTRANAWRGNEPYLRLHECACHDKAREASLHKDSVMTRPEFKLDARNNSSRPLTFEEVVSELFNNEAFLPTTEALPNLADAFLQPIDLPFSEMPGPIAPDQVKSKLADSRCRLMKVINRWERSGNGFGQMRDEDMKDESSDKDIDDYQSDSELDADKDVTTNFGHLIEENFMEGDNRKSFVWHHDGDADHLLYFWHLLDHQGILSKVINKLDRNVAADCDSKLPDVTGVGNRGEKRKQIKEKDVTAERSFRSEVGGALSGLACQAMIENRDRVRRTVNDYKVLKIRELNQDVKEAYESMETEAQSDLDQIEEQMVACQKKHNLAPKVKATDV